MPPSPRKLEVWQVTMTAHVNHRPEIEQAEEVGFYSVLGVAAVALLLLFGIYELAQHALAGVASLFSGI